jgi:predicted negative regulator of RcsB-dependent stress response
MSIYMTEKEQLENIKKWWLRHGTAITVVLCFVFLGVAGFRYWNWHQAKVQQQSSIIYEQMMVAYSNRDLKSMHSYANELMKESAGSVYADAAHLILAKVYVSKNKLDNAQEELAIVAQKSRMPALKQIAQIRLARILAEKKSYTDALGELSIMSDPTYLPVINELKGDIYQQLGQYKEALNAYGLALQGTKDKGMGNTFLEMKRNELALKKV